MYIFLARGSCRPHIASKFIAGLFVIASLNIEKKLAKGNRLVEIKDSGLKKFNDFLFSAIDEEVCLYKFYFYMI